MLSLSTVIDPLGVHAASSDVARDINRQIVLNLIRTRQPVSRADLARLSGMQRSTISLIVEELMEQEWVREGPTGRPPRGRRPTYLHLNNERAIIAVDVRPSKILVAVSDVNGKLGFQHAMPTPPDPEAAVKAIIASLDEAIRTCHGRKIDGIGVSVPGRFNHKLDRLVFAPNLNWRDVELRGPIARSTGFDVVIENAANACALAAVWFDNLAHCCNLVALTISEGIGAGLLIDGRLAHGFGDMAGEFGHIPIEPEGPLCTCGSRGCWEVFASNRAALRYYSESEPNVAALTFETLLARADQGDHNAAGAIERMAHYLGRGMRMFVAGLAPECIVIVGDLTQSWQRFGPVIEAYIRAQVLPGGTVPQLVPGQNGALARLRGTVALVLQKDFGMGTEENSVRLLPSRRR